MFERFAPELRKAVVDGQAFCREAGAAEISTEHLFFGLLAQRSGFAAEFLSARLPDSEELADEFAQVRRRGELSESDTEALGELGIDVDRVVDAVERAHGVNALAPRGERGGARGFLRSRGVDHAAFSQEAKAVLSQCLREAVSLGDRRIGGEHLLLALLRRRTIVSDVLRNHGIDESAVREVLSEKFKTPEDGIPSMRGMQLALNVIELVVSDMPATLAFYRFLGLDIPAEADEAPHVEADLSDGIKLVFDTEQTIRSFDTDWSPPQGGHRVALACACDSPAHVDKAYAEITGAGYEGHLAPWDAFWGMRYAVVHDPNGVPVDLFATLTTTA